jgi:membrane protein
MRAAWSLVKDTVLECRENKVQRLAAALAYYAMCSLPPLFILIAALTDLVYGEVIADGRGLTRLQTFLGQTGLDAVATLISGVQVQASELGTTLIGAAGLLFVASGLFNHLRDSLNTIWEVTARPDHPVRGYLFSRLLAILMVLSVGVIAFSSLLLSIGLERFEHSLAALLPGTLVWLVLRGVHLLLAFGITTVLVALTYKMLPDTRVVWHDIWIGAGVTALLIVVSQALVGMYLRSSQVGSAYSILGAVVIILVWVYYSALVFFFGAELTWMYANRFGSRIVPAPHALSLSAGDRAAQGMLRTSELEATAEGKQREA